MFVAMGDPLYPPQFDRAPNYDGFTPQSAVSSFNLPLIYDSALTTPVSLDADSPVLVSKPAASAIHWAREQNQMNYPMRDSRAIFNQNTNNRMKSNAKDSTLSLQVPQGSGGDLGLGFSPYIFDSPQNLCPPTPYWGSFGVSGAQVTSPTTSLPSNAHSASQISSASTTSMNHSTPLSHNSAPILITPTPSQLRPGKRTHESPIKPEHQGMQFPHRPPPQNNHSPNHFNPPTKRESPPLPHSTQKRRKPSDAVTPMYNQNQVLPSTDSTATPSNVVLQGSQPRFTPMDNQSQHNVITEEEEFLLHLRDVRDPKPDWKKTAIEFNEKMGKNYRIPALQMRYSRLKERLRVWTEKDVKALTRSKAAFEKTKWENVANGMLQFGCSEKWSARACQLKHAELNPDELDEAPTEFSPDPETQSASESDRHNSYVNLGMHEYGMDRQEQQHQNQQQQPQQQQQQPQQQRTPEGKVSREHSADPRADQSYKVIAADANNQLQLLRQQQQLATKRLQLEQQHHQHQHRQQQQQNWNVGGQ